MNMENMQSFRLYDFNIYNDSKSFLEQSESEDDDASGGENRNTNESRRREDTNQFFIQMFGIDEKGMTCSIIAEDFKPFFYVKVGNHWTNTIKNSFLEYIQSKIGKYYENSITECKIVDKKKLYGFDNGKEHKFVLFVFKNIQVFNKVRNLWYYQQKDNERKLLSDGLLFHKTKTYLYESNIPPLLRFFHIKNISPSGWIALPKRKTIEIKRNKKTNCHFEFIINFKDIVPLNDKETCVPYKICSFDIEASSSHGDFPIPVKSYKKLATNIIEYFEKIHVELNADNCKTYLTDIILSAFGFKSMIEIDIVYPKKPPSDVNKLHGLIDDWFAYDLLNEDDNTQNEHAVDGNNSSMTIEEMFENMNSKEDEDVVYHDVDVDVDVDVDDGLDADDGSDVDNKSDTKKFAISTKTQNKQNKPKKTIINVLCDKKMDRNEKVVEINKSLNKKFPRLEGDKITFIGSTFLKYGTNEPYLNHCAVLNSCDSIPVENSQIECYDNEKDLLLAWKDLIQKENPDIIIGYNIFAFDYEFMFRRAEENNCVEEFLKLSRNNNEICAAKDVNTGRYKLEESKVQIASGTHETRFIKMNGRIQVDLYNFFRKEENLISYKLDYVSGYFIGDFVQSIVPMVAKNKEHYTIESGNLTGLQPGSYIHFEEIGHTTNYYNNGEKFQILTVSKKEGKFTILANQTQQYQVCPDLKSKKVRWCLAKDDMSYKDLFRMTNESSVERAIIAKYCIQDCNLLHHLMIKKDIITGYIEMAKICSVPISFLVFRGQGIKLTSCVAKKCRENNILMPVIEKLQYDDGYEGAIVLDPKCDLYMDNPVACVDYASLYPSSQMSENISQDSKVWTKEYDLSNVLIHEQGERNEKGEFIYDNLPEYEYVDITYDTFKYVRKSPSSAAEKVKKGYKICRFAQFPVGRRAIMPSILEELLTARKTTRKKIPLETDEFMKNVLDKRQLAYKLTANSLYGQCGARTSTFYDKDVAASTTATGRLLLTYAKKVIEECYGNNTCNTKNYGPVLTKAEYIYGDSVPKYTPVYVSTFKKNGKNGKNDGIKSELNRVFDICTIEELGKKYGNNNWIKCVEEGKQEKEFCELENVETWTEKGWTRLHRIIRHTLAEHKKIIRIQTHTGLVDVTDDHSLLRMDATEISPKDVKIGTELLHNKLPINETFTDTISKEEAQLMGVLFGDGSCGFPYEILLGSQEIRQAFWNGLYDAGGKKYANGYISIDQKNQIGASQICWLAQSLGWKTSINCESDKPHIFRVFMTKNKLRKNTYAVEKMQEINYEGYVYDLTTENHHFAAGIGNIIVHNTDSVFFTFNLATLDGKPIRGKDALEITIELAQEAGHLASSFLKNPHDLEYEKTFMPFCLLSKKRYVGMLYEHDPNKGKRKEMGIVLKRRDNAPIVKDIYGGIIDILMKEQNIQKAIDFLKSCLKNIVDEKYPIDKLIITKSLRSGYKKPQQIAHKVLADRIMERDPGNKPCSGDRIPFVFIHNPDKKALQGNRIETPTFVLENNIKIDYSFYITNQILNPVQQVFALVLEKIWEMQNKKSKIKHFMNDVQELRKKTPANKFEEKLEDLRSKEIKILLFDEFLRETNNNKNNTKPLTSYFKPTK